mmetsp:Transcript_2356/g.3512  ORF Transcript_2356/g.3512 Transcript_2356/m.3512 type:complete len:117 (-) Transcript_2356:58-408(-)
MNNSFKVEVEGLPVHGHGEGGLVVLLHGINHGGELGTGGTRYGGTDTALMSSGALGSGKEGEEFTLSIDFEFEVEVVDHVSVILDLFGSTDGFGRGRGDETEEDDGFGKHGSDGIG